MLFYDPFGNQSTFVSFVLKVKQFKADIKLMSN